MEEEAQPKEKEKDISVTKENEDSTIYSGIRDTILNQIKSIDLDGSFGTKIDTLARHIMWIREHDPGAKSIVYVFSELFFPNQCFVPNSKTLPRSNTLPQQSSLY